MEQYLRKDNNGKQASYGRELRCTCSWDISPGEGGRQRVRRPRVTRRNAPLNILGYWRPVRLSSAESLRLAVETRTIPR